MTGPPEPAIVGIKAAYSAPDRHYHNLAHVLDCLDKLDLCAPESNVKPEIEFALWLHDVVYNSHAHDNELQSACRAADILSDAGAPKDVSQRIQGLIMATAHRAEPELRNQALICDVDLSILGASPDKFREYDRQIALEYAWVPPEIYRKKRGAVLANFLRRPRIYRTENYYRRFESQARANIEKVCHGRYDAPTLGCKT